MNHVSAITGRLSLRPPQKESLELLARLVEKIPLNKERDLAALLEAVKAEVPSFTDLSGISRRCALLWQPALARRG